MLNIKQIEKIFNKPLIAEPTIKAAAVLVPVINCDNQPHLLLQVRSSQLAWQPGDICFPGGHIEPFDATPIAAAKRETYEEIGIPIENINILGQLPSFSSTLGFKIYPIVGELTSLTQLKLNYDEVDKVFTVPIDYLLNSQPRQAAMQVAHKPSDNFPFELLPTQSRDWKKYSQHNLYFYHYNEYVIWGLTAQIVKLFLDAIRQDSIS